VSTAGSLASESIAGQGMATTEGLAMASTRESTGQVPIEGLAASTAAVVPADVATDRFAARASVVVAIARHLAEAPWDSVATADPPEVESLAVGMAVSQSIATAGSTATTRKATPVRWGLSQAP
jgi:hypothetical protein